MKKLTLLLLIVLLFNVIGCQYPRKNKMLETYSNDKNFITLFGEIVAIDNTNDTTYFSIKCEELKQFISTEKDICKYRVFSNQKTNLYIGDEIIFATSSVRFFQDWLPIISITKDNIDILKFEEGKNNLIDWVNQLQYK